MKKIILLLLILFITTNCFGATRLDDEGTSQGFINTLDFVGGNVTATRSGITGTVTISGGSTDASYVTLGSSGDLSDERTLTAGQSISLTDAGANSTVTVSADTATNTTLGVISADSNHFNIGSTGMLNLSTGADKQHHFFNGTLLESFDALVTSDGATVTLTVTNAGGGDLTMMFSDHYTTLSTPATIELTAGSDASPKGNWIYIPKSTKVLTKSETAWDTNEHIKIGYFLVPSAGFVQTNGTYINQNWNDHSTGTNNQGHLTHITERSRTDGAYYFSGIDGNGTDNYLTPTAGNVEFKSTAGIVMQMHRHNFGAKDTSSGDVVLVKNWSGDAWHDITNLYDIVADSGGNTITNNRYFNLVFWGVANKGGEFTSIMCNLPSGFYNNQGDAESDALGYDDFTIPRQFNLDSSTGFLIARMTIQMKTGGGTWVVASSVDLRGIKPTTATGGVGSIVTTFADNAFDIFDESDVTKHLAFDVGSNVTTGTTRTMKVPDESGTIALVENSHDFVTMAGTPDYLTVSNNVITRGTIDIGDDTNLTAGDGLTLNDDDMDFDGGASPQGELGGTWGSPTVDATHSGSAHHAEVTNYVTNDASDTMSGTLTADGLTLGANENITLSNQTISHDTTTFMVNDSIRQTGTHYIQEQADADSDLAGYGQVWVNSATPNELYFTNDAGTDFQLGDGAKIFVGNTTKNSADASATQEITGVGFTPKAVWFLVNQDLSAGEASWGFDDGSTSRNMNDRYNQTVNSYAGGSSSIFVYQSSGTWHTGAISAFGSDGFTISWSKTGSPSGTFVVSYLCIG